MFDAIVRGVRQSYVASGARYGCGLAIGGMKKNGSLQSKACGASSVASLSLVNNCVQRRAASETFRPTVPILADDAAKLPTTRSLQLQTSSRVLESFSVKLVHIGKP